MLCNSSVKLRNVSNIQNPFTFLTFTEAITCDNHKNESIGEHVYDIWLKTLDNSVYEIWLKNVCCE